MTASTLQRHPKTGLPVEEVPTFAVGDLVTENFLSDGHPAVVVAVTAKTVWVSSVSFIGNFSATDAPGYNGYGDSGTITVDPESVEQAMARGKSGASKYVLRVSPRPTRGSMREEEQYGGEFHRARWAVPNSRAGSLSAGARYRRDPHV
jgi:hypothetical protein